jgi:hypothetical protein
MAIEGQTRDQVKEQLSAYHGKEETKLR